MPPLLCYTLGKEVTGMSKTSAGLVSYAIAQLGKPYWWGCFGQTATAGLLTAKRAQYPDSYTAADFAGQLGQKVHDCVGLIKGYRWCDTADSEPIYVGSQDVAVGGLYDQCGSKGPISTMPDTPGVCVFMAGMGHVGVYIGGGYVVEAMGHAYGVVRTQLSGRGWGFWGKPAWIDYGTEEDAVVHDTGAPTQIKPSYKYSIGLYLLKPGMVDEQVRTAQRLLIARGQLAAGEDDGEFGPKTLAAVEKFQASKGLLADGEIGGDTWTALLTLR